MNYTERLNELAFKQWDALDENRESDVVDFLNRAGTFRTFGEGLTTLIQKKYHSVSSQDVIDFIITSSKMNAVNLKEIASKGTLNNWFNEGLRPKKGEDSREKIFALAFALQFSVEETAELFHKVYLDRAFDFRSENEIVYYYCLSSGKSWGDAKRIISSIEHIESSNDMTEYTSEIKAEIDKLNDENDLLSYIITHRHNLEKSNVTAKSKLAKLLVEAKIYASKEAELPEHEGQFDGCWKKEDTVSVNFMYGIITETMPSTKKGTTTIFKDARLPKEIANRFPEVASFSEKEPTYESIRKMIILLFSYVFWYHVQWEKKDCDLDDYTAQLDSLLNECGFSTMYYGNPYDWLFLFCTLSEYPLDAFRGILYESLNIQD
ncbi:MAG: hypothetical protein ACI4MS_08410 [Candidatus Coproplasma sp.]